MWSSAVIPEKGKAINCIEYMITQRVFIDSTKPLSIHILIVISDWFASDCVWSVDNLAVVSSSDSFFFTKVPNKASSRLELNGTNCFPLSICIFPENYQNCYSSFWENCVVECFLQQKVQIYSSTHFEKVPKLARYFYLSNVIKVGALFRSPTLCTSTQTYGQNEYFCYKCHFIGLYGLKWIKVSIPLLLYQK